VEQDDSQNPKKDLTSLSDFKFPEMEPNPEPSSGPSISLTEEAQIEKVEAFESLDTLTSQSGTETAPTEPGPGFTFDASPDLAQALDAPSLDQAPAANEPAFDHIQEMPSASEPEIKFGEMSPPPPSEQVLSDVKKFSENMAPKTTIAAGYPFSLRIEGHLKPEEQEKLVDLISKEKMGIRAMDLELQFKTGHVLIPRISEYAGVLLVQALRGTNAEMKLAPSDQVFSTSDTKEEAIPERESHTVSSIGDASPFEHPAEHIPVTSEHHLSGFSPGTVIDTVAASATIKAMSVEMETSAEYLEILENLKRELKYKAHHKGGTAVVDFKVTLSPLSIPTHYRITAMGAAVKIDQNRSSLSSTLGDTSKDAQEWEPIV
jgi:uncharacterized protein YbjQ (UPF0145 family)